MPSLPGDTGSGRGLSLRNPGLPLIRTPGWPTGESHTTAPTPGPRVKGPAGTFKSLSRPMEGFWIQLLAILTLLTQSGSPSNTTELIRAVGGSVTFHGPKTEGNPALWRFGNVPIVTVVFDDPPRLVFSKDEYRNRSTVSEDGRALTISQLSTKDAGNYSVTIDVKKSTFTLWVYKELPEPTATHKSLNCTDGRWRVTLNCSAPDTGFGNVSYLCRVTFWPWDEEFVGPTVNKSSLDSVDLLTCTARNAVSRRNVTVTIPIPKGLCPGAPSGSSVEIRIVIGVGVVVLLLVFLVLFCKCQGCWPRGRAGEPRGRAGEQVV